MRTSRPSLATVLLLAAALGACEKQPVVGTCPRVVQAPEAFLDYWFFPEGSYWVYRQRGSNPAVYDTVRAAKPRLRVFKPGQNTYGLPPCVEIYEAHFSHSNRTFFRGYSDLNQFFGTESIFCQGNAAGWAITQSNEAGNTYSTGLLLTHPLPAPGGRLSPTGPTLLDTLAPNVPAGRFRGSLHFATSFRDSTAGNFVRRYHLARGVGYTRKVYTGIGTWELTSYYIAPR